MTQNFPLEWSKMGLILFRIGFSYLVFYFIFLSNFVVDSVSGPGVLTFARHVNTPLKFISDAFIGVINHLFIGNTYDEDIYTGIGDTSWFIMACLTYLFIAILISLIWTLIDKRKSHNGLYALLNIYARYYLAFVLSGYGLTKLFSTQFGEPQLSYLIEPLGNIDPHILLWTFMGASESYNIFIGLLETSTAILLLFRRTTRLGSLIAIAILVNVLILNIGYDTLVKAFITNLLFINMFILGPHINGLLSFFLSNRYTSVGDSTINIELKICPWVRYGVKSLVVVFMLFYHYTVNINMLEHSSNPQLASLEGIYEAKEFYRNNQFRPPLTTDSSRFRRIVINEEGYLTFQFMNDSSVQYDIKGDTVDKSIALSTWRDSTFKSKLRYSIINPQEYLFEGVYEGDSIKVISKKINLNDFVLLRSKGKMKWVWW